VLVAELVPDVPRLWPVFVVGAFAILSATVVSGIVMVVAAIASGDIRWPPQPQELRAWLEKLADSKFGLAVLVLPGQLTFAAVALGAAALSREPWRARLGLHSGRLPRWTWPLFLLGTPVIGWFSSLIMSRFTAEPSEQLKMFERMFQFHSTSSLVVLLLLVSVLPGFVEEMLFRGYLQRRLLTRLSAVTSIGICSAFFAAAHMDPMHAVAVLPLGIWLGVVAWRADSVWPAIFGHMGNNGFAIVMATLMGPAPDVDRVSPWIVGMLGLSMFAFAGALAVLFAGRPENTRQAVGT
jgi:membrane protease YdiL (CAAX protease family)